MSEAPLNMEGSMPKPTIGRIVLYTLTALDAERINSARNHAPLDHTGSERIRHGNRVYHGEEYPMLIVRVWDASEIPAVNGQVFLDGNDSLWVYAVQPFVESVLPTPGTWRWPPRVEEPQVNTADVALRSLRDELRLKRDEQARQAETISRLRTELAQSHADAERFRTLAQYMGYGREVYIGTRHTRWELTLKGEWQSLADAVDALRTPDAAPKGLVAHTVEEPC